MESHFGGANEFFKSAPTLNDEFIIRGNVDKFIRKHCELRNRLVCITSGGTSAPLERKCVRFLHNCSCGNRGAVSAEYFLQAGYAVIFLYRRNSSQPYCRSVLQCFKPDYNCSLEERIAVAERALRLYDELLLIIARSMDYLQKNAMFYLAAAVADFYVPWEAMVEHKIQSGAGPLTLELALVPKMMRVLRREWAPSAFCVSFKLETDPTMLMRKADEALHKYDVHVVVANDLATRNDQVIVVTKEGKKTVDRDSESNLERSLVGFLKQKHMEYILNQ